MREKGKNSQEKNSKPSGGGGGGGRKKKKEAGEKHPGLRVPGNLAESLR